MYDALYIAGASLIAVWGSALLLNVNSLAERYGRRGWELRQRGYQPGYDQVPFARLITPSTTAGARRLGAGLLVLGGFPILATLSGA